MSEPADGVQLERVVEEIERALLPEGFTVERRVRMSDPDTHEVTAELDIVIKGPLGSSTVEWLIECRDRPSEGPSPIGWIEQLVGRRARLHFQRVFAVSTTGFSGPAETHAKEVDIDLRTVRTIEDIAHDFGVTTFPLREHRFDPTGPVRVRGHKGNLPPSQRPPEFRLPGEKAFTELSVFVTDILRERDRLPESDGVMVVDFEYGRPCQMRTPQRVLHLQGFAVQGELHSWIVEARALWAKVYADDRRVIGKQGQFEWQTRHGPVKATLMITEREDRTEFRIDVPGGQLPDGTKPRALKVWRIPKS